MPTRARNSRRRGQGKRRHYVHSHPLLVGERLEERLCLTSDVSLAPPIPGGIYSASNINQADIALLADVARARYGVDGSGIKIGIISNSFNTLGGLSYDVAHDVLPDDVTIVHEAESPNDDEGRAMAQLIHAIAPGAELYFTAPFNLATSESGTENALNEMNQWADRIQELVDLGCQIIVDDLSWPNEPWFQDGIIAIAVDQAVRQGAVYISAAANHGNFSYASPFRPVTPSDVERSQLRGLFPNVELHDFDSGDGVQLLQWIDVASFNDFSLQWDQPLRNNQSTMELFFFDEDMSLIDTGFGDPAYPNLFHPSEASDSTTEPPYPGLPSQFYVAIGHHLDGSPRPGYIKWIATINGATATATPPAVASTVWGHANSALGISVAAAPYWGTPAYLQSPPLLTYFSSWGGTPIFFDVDGNRLPAAEYRQQPRFTAPQGANTSFFGQEDADLDGLPNFMGTSAAAPNTAAVVALMLDLDPTLSPETVARILAESATTMPTPFYDPSAQNGSFNFATGAGLIQADKALASVAALAITGTVFEDFDGNGVQTPDELPVPGVKVFLDSNGNGLYDVAPAPASGAAYAEYLATLAIDVPAAEITPNPNHSPSGAPAVSTLSWPTKAFSPIEVSHLPGTVVDLALSFKLRVTAGEPDTAAIFMTLVNPLGIRVPVVGTQVVGGIGSQPSISQTPFLWKDVDVTVVQTATAAGANSSLVDLNSFRETSANGTWYLEVMNPDPDHTYTLESWSLFLRTAEQETTTTADGSYRFPSSVLSLSTVVGAFTPTVELPADRSLLLPSLPHSLTLALGESKIVNFALSVPRVQRPQLERTATLVFDLSQVGPQPFLFSWADLAGAVLAAPASQRFVVTSTLSGRLEKWTGSAWIDATLVPTSGNPQSLIRTLASRIVHPNDQLRWIPPTDSRLPLSAFQICGWLGGGRTSESAIVSIDISSTADEPVGTSR